MQICMVKICFYGNGYIHTKSYTKVEILICYQEGILIYFVVYHFGFVSIIFWNLEVGELSAMFFAAKMDWICARSQCDACLFIIQMHTIIIFKVTVLRHARKRCQSQAEIYPKRTSATWTTSWWVRGSLLWPVHDWMWPDIPRLLALYEVGRWDRASRQIHWAASSSVRFREFNLVSIIGLSLVLLSICVCFPS